MKFAFFSLLLAGILFFSCNNAPEEEKPGLIDTIQTASGLQYYYIKKGEGRKIEKGCEVGTYLSLMVEDSVVWNTDESPDSLFTYIADFTRLIKGFSEITLLLREGDEVVAILPDSLAYGAKGAGDVIPPHATLIYDKFKVVKVGEPKALLADTLLPVLNSEGFEAMLKKKDQIINGENAAKYHTGNEQIYALWYELTNLEKNKEALELATYFATETNDTQLKFYIVRSLENLGEFQVAIDSLTSIINSEADNEMYKIKLEDLKEKLNKE